MIYLDEKMLRDTKEFSTMIAKEKTFIRHNIKSQKAIQKSLLNYINKISSHSYDIPLKDQDTAIRFLQHSKKCYHVCTKNLHRLEVLLSEIKVLNYEYDNDKDKEKLTKFSDYYIKTMIKISKSTSEIENFLSAISSRSVLKFSNSKTSVKAKKNSKKISEKKSINHSEISTEKNIKNIPEKESINHSEISVEKNIKNISAKESIYPSKESDEKNIKNASEEESMSPSEENAEKGPKNISEKESMTLSEENVKKNLKNVSEEESTNPSEESTEKNIRNISAKESINPSEENAEKNPKNVSEKESISPSEESAEKNIKNVSAEQSIPPSETPVDMNNEYDYQNNTLLVSESKGKVVLPYTISTLKTELEGNSDKYSSIDDLIDKRYTLPYTNFKNVPFARFRETYNLVRKREHGSVKEAFLLGMELFFNYNLHPAIIAACKSQDELDIYLDYLDTNETSKFDCFKIVFDILPTIKATKQKDQLFE